MKLTGAQLKHAFGKNLLTENLTNSSEHYQVNKGVEIIFDDAQNRLVSLKVDGVPVDDDLLYCVGLASFHFNNFDKVLGLCRDEVLRNGRPLSLAT